MCAACLYVCMYVCMYACRYVRMYVCMHVCMYVCMCVCVYAGKVDVLVATDLASRGIDVTGVTHVINYDTPQTIRSYLHRIGTCSCTQYVYVYVCVYACACMCARMQYVLFVPQGT